MIAETARDLTAEWVSAALSGTGESTTVALVTAERVGTGQMGTTYRLLLDYADGTSGPRRLIAKLAAENPDVRALVADGYRKEVTFYQTLAPTVSVRAPACRYAAISADATTFTLLLEDLDPATPGVQAQGCTVDQAEAALLNVAKLHGPRWNDETLLDEGLQFYGAAADFVAQLQAGATEDFIEYFGDRLEPGAATTLRMAAERTAAWLTTRQEPFAPLHGDYRLDNLMFSGDADVVAVDWQTLSLGPAARDVAYFLGTSLDVELRRRHEHRLVGTYHDELTRQGVTGYSTESCFDDYRLGQLQAPMITTLGCMYSPGDRSSDIDEMFLTMANRSCAAITDLQSFDLIA
ncbi:phosphotransferase [Mycolicibacterium porcinum]|uniref:phosphotransferase n=1 Tax=Mycolicibacterium porcinum TaxID=39693 RepID=UPI00118FFE5D|nr:phosphotransferase [Mycolicibacterium porcinum]TVY00857.1 phosphotransferase [Mycolicibacterium porcinum]